MNEKIFITNIILFIKSPKLFLKKIIKFLYLKKLKKKDILKWNLEILKYEGLRFGVNCRIYPSVTFNSEPELVTIGNNVIIAGGVKFLTHDGSPMIFRNEIGEKEIYGEIVIGDNVFIGMNSIILPNTKVGNNVIIGASSVVTKNIPNDSIVIGNPAKFILKTSVYKRFMLKHKNLLKAGMYMPVNDKNEMIFKHFNLEVFSFPNEYRYLKK